MPNYTSKLNNLQNRRQDAITRQFMVTDSFNKKEYGESVTYALEAMEPIAQSYTDNTFLACDRIKSQLSKGLANYDISVDYRYQGSVPTNTHIKLYSDVDLLTIHQKFYTLQPPQVPYIPYYGNPVSDLDILRQRTRQILSSAFPTCEIDDSGSKCLHISGASLGRKVDIIPANWYDSLKYSETHDEDYRGVQVLDRNKMERILNYPFLHIYWINNKDERVLGNEKRMIRLLKSLKADADTDITMSSYDIASIIYRMDDSELIVGRTERLKLLKRTNVYLLKIINNEIFRDSLYVANATRKIFSRDGAKVSELLKLQLELQDLINEVSVELRPRYQELDSSTVYYGI